MMNRKRWTEYEMRSDLPGYRKICVECGDDIDAEILSYYIKRGGIIKEPRGRDHRECVYVYFPL